MNGIMDLKSVRTRKALGNGFTLIEMLVSVIIFVIILLAVYSFFDKGQWLYLQSDKRSNIQASARLTMEAIERDLRLMAYGVPRAGKVGATATRWTPSLFLADGDQIGFRADIDNGSAYLTQDSASGDTVIFVPAADGGKYPDGTNLIIVSRRTNWFDTVSTGPDSVAGSIDIADPLPTTFRATTGKVYTMEEVFWSFTSDPSYPFGTVERQENHPQLPDGTASGTWETMATNVQSLTFEYFAGTVAVTPVPLTSTQAETVTRIVVTLVAKDRSDKVGEYQTVTLKSEIRVRNMGLIGG